jgi:mannose-6-phosphate isomerase-like protein (cupin superfamily)
MDYELNEIADESKEFIVEIFREEIRNLARDNMNFLQVLSTGPHSQVLVMSLLPGEDFGEGISHSDQFVIVEHGTGELTVEGMTTPFAPGEVVHIPGGLHHNLRADRENNVKLAVVCAPALYPPRDCQPTKAEAAAAQAEAQARDSRHELARTRSRFLATERG